MLFVFLSLSILPLRAGADGRKGKERKIINWQGFDALEGLGVLIRA